METDKWRVIVDTNLNTERSERLRRIMRKASYFDDPCFQLFIWYPVPDGKWEIMFGSEHPDEIHYHVWESRGLDAVAKAWGVDRKMLWPGIGDNVIPTGYVDFKEHPKFPGRDVPFLIIPETLPSGWDLDKVKDNLKCGQRINEVVTSKRRNFDPDAYQKFLNTIRDIRLYRTMDFEQTVY